MSFIEDDLIKVDATIDRFQLKEAEEHQAVWAEDQQQPQAGEEDPRSLQLKAIVRALSTTSSTRPLLRRSKVRGLLGQIARQDDGRTIKTETISEENAGLEWVATGKAAVQVYGLVLGSLLDRTLPLGESIWYWNDILSSYPNIVLYTVQMSPFRFWNQTKEVVADARQKFRSASDLRTSAQEAGATLAESWREFYGLVRNSIKERSLAQAQSKILSPLSISRQQVRRNLEHIKDVRKASAVSIGRLVRECLVFDAAPEDHKHGALPHLAVAQGEHWQTTIARTVCLLENATKGHSDEESYSLEPATATASEVAESLVKILDQYLPQQEVEAVSTRLKHGKPSRVVRYWIPAVALLLSGSTLLRVFANRKAEITQWFQELGQTSIDFWTNWVLEPAKKLLGTIRHDETSEIAIQSRDSLRADRESLERMVIDFAIQHPENGVNYTDSQVTELKMKVKQGDLTPVLKAYEHEMQSPIKNAIVGDLVRTLLIQVQKTKVDVEVAIGGIDSLLKSQELLFGFVGVAPGVLISWFLFQWVRNTFGGRKGLRQGQRKNETVRLVRNIDRTLTSSDLDNDSIISEESHGLLLCEAHLLRQRAVQVLPKNVQREFMEDLEDLLDVKAGVPAQINALRRLEWAYGKWLQT